MVTRHWSKDVIVSSPFEARVTGVVSIAFECTTPIVSDIRVAGVAVRVSPCKSERCFISIVPTPVP